MYDGGLHYNNGRRGQDEHFRGRVSHFPQELQFGNASIIIRNTTVADSGVYTCDFPHLQPEQRLCIKLVVELTLKDRSGEIPGAAPKPFVGILNISEDEALLKCEVRGASPKPKVEWRDSDGNILPAEEPQVSRTGERYDITLLTTVTRTNSSLFHCVATQEEMGHVTRDQIDVRYCGAAPKPFVGILNISEDEALLKCEVRGASPKPKVEWRDSDGNILPAEEPQVSHTGERYDITLLTTVTRTNSSLFLCVATQEEMGHVTRDQIDVRYCEKTSEVKSHCGVGVLIGLWFSGVLTVAATLAPSVAAKCIRKHKKASQRNQRDDPSKEACNGDTSLTNCLTSQL
ncbi:inactive tyrosine-protein kinase 7-like [Simochromis diagramma]|uniref:inactive tyrosine-protein kinase 7-like n=1 Tax=Simochromis diagramma TaxID=43689 RepID=UPI001A7EF9B2|nr:inactive tyrosine-protein kinase 7-like [Simochromis diagramma]